MGSGTGFSAAWIFAAARAALARLVPEERPGVLRVIDARVGEHVLRGLRCRESDHWAAGGRLLCSRGLSRGARLARARRADQNLEGAGRAAWNSAAARSTRSHVPVSSPHAGVAVPASCSSRIFASVPS